jgi:hypothetical protein
MGAYEFRLLEHNFNPGDPNVDAGRGSRADVDRLSRDGWWVEASTVAYPYVHILWKRPVGGPEARAPENHDICQEKQAALQANVEQAIAERDTALANAEKHEADARQMAALRDQAVSQAAQLQRQLAAQTPDS